MGAIPFPVRLASSVVVVHVLAGLLSTVDALAGFGGEDGGHDGRVADATITPLDPADAGVPGEGDLITPPPPDADTQPRPAEPPRRPPEPPPQPGVLRIPPPPPGPAPGPHRLEELTVVGTAEARTAGSAHLLKPRDLARMRYDNVESVVKSVPGVYARGEDGFGLRPNIGIRGTAPDRSKKVTLMEDGVLFGPAPYSAPAAYFFPLVTRMDRVRVIKGPGSVVFGPQTVGGAIDLVTRGIPFDESGFIDLAAGQYDYGMFHGAYGASTARSGYVLEGVHLRTSGFKQLDGGGDTGFDKNEWMWKGRYLLSTDPGAQQEVRLKLGYSDEDSRESYLGLSDADFRATPARRYAASQLDHMAWHRTQIVASYHAEIAQAFTVDVAAYRHDFQRTWRKVNHLGGTRVRNQNGVGQHLEAPISIADVLASPSDGRNALYRGVLAGDSDSSGIDDTIYVGPNRRLFVSQGVQAVAAWSGTSGPVAHRLELGARLHHDRIDRLHTEDGFLMRGGKLVWDGLGTITTSDERAWTTAIALHVADALTCGPVTLTPGVRVELISMRLHDRLEGVEYASTPQRVVIPGVGAYAALAPSFGLLAGVYRGFSPAIPAAPNTVLPETSINYEAGARLSSPRMRAEAIGFFNDYQNLTSVCGGAEGCSAVGKDTQADAGRAHIWGVEVYANGDVVRRPRLVVPLALAYTYTRTKLLDAFDSSDPTLGMVRAGYELPFVPRHQLAASMAVELPRGSLAVAASYVAAMREIAGEGPTPPERPRTDASLVIDATARVRLTSSGQAYVSVRNLFDAADIAARLPFGARPNAPRWVQLGTRWSF